jgi:hypothetical protein
MNRQAAVQPEYISAAEAARLLACDRTHIPKLADAGLVGFRRIPGVARVKYNRADVERLRAESFVPSAKGKPGRSASRHAG